MLNRDGGWESSEMERRPMACNRQLRVPEMVPDAVAIKALTTTVLTDFYR